MFCSKKTFVTLLKRTVVTLDKTWIRRVNNRSKIGSREWVGFGANGGAHYADRADLPFPSVRFRETTNEMIALREKEKGDWRKLTCDEKKCLYRASFCQTFAEFLAPTGEWKSVLGVTLMIASLGLWMFFAVRLFIYDGLPDSLCEESRRAQLRRLLDIKFNPVTGVSSQWDYEKDDWKKKMWHTSGR